MRILFVCAGNTCRSPMAQALLRKALTQDRASDLKDIEVWSAGIWARSGQPASPEALEVMSYFGIDLSQHRTRCLEPNLVQDADLILTMTGSQCRELLNQFPQKRQNIFPLAEYAGKALIDVEDPYGSGVEVYSRTAEQIEQLIKEVIKRLRQQEKNLEEQL